MVKKRAGGEKCNKSIDQNISRPVEVGSLGFILDSKQYAKEIEHRTPNSLPFFYSGPTCVRFTTTSRKPANTLPVVFIVCGGWGNNEKRKSRSAVSISKKSIIEKLWRKMNA